jgi:hypothetical protein
LAPEPFPDPGAARSGFDAEVVDVDLELRMHVRVQDAGACRKSERQ